MVSVWRQHPYRITLWSLGLLLLLIFPLHFSYADFLGIGEALGKMFFNICLAMGGAVLLMGSLFLDYTLLWLVVKMGDFFQPGSNSLGGAVTLGWVLIRDLLNMGFIFGLIFIGIKTILNSENSNTRKQLGYLIAAALLINFSLYITQLIVDLTNLIAVQFYKLIITGGVGSGQAGSNTTDAVSPIAAQFMDSVGLSSIFSPKGLDPSLVSGGSLFLFSLLILIFFVVAGIAFLLGGILIVTRFVALVLYMVFSPLMFIGWILPYFQSVASGWWKGFFKYAFFGPVYIFLIYLSVNILRGLVATMSTVTGGDPKTTLAKGLTEKTISFDFVGMVMSFAIMIGLLWASLKIGDKMSIAGSTMAMRGFKGTTGGLQGWAYRNTAGRAMNRAVLGYDYLNQKSDGKLGNWGGERARQLAVKARNYDAGGTGLQAVQDASAKRSTDNRSRVASSRRMSDVKSGDAKAIASMTDNELVTGLQDKKTNASLVANAHLLKPKQIEAIMKSDLDGKTKDEILKASKEKLESEAKTEAGAEAIYNQYKKDITKLPSEVLTSEEFAKHLKDTSVLSKLADMEGLSLEDKRKIKDNVLKAGDGSDTESLSDWFENDRRHGAKFSI